MGSVSSTNAGVANLLQMLQDGGSSVLTSSRVTDALQNASASDVVQLSVDAIKSQNMDALFGVTSSSNTNASSLESMLTGKTATTGTTQNTLDTGILSSEQLAQATPADQASYYQSAAQALQTQAMVTNGIFSNKSGSLINVVG